LIGRRDIRGQTKLEFPGPQYKNPIRAPSPATAHRKHYRQSKLFHNKKHSAKKTCFFLHPCKETTKLNTEFYIVINRVQIQLFNHILLLQHEKHTHLHIKSAAKKYYLLTQPSKTSAIWWNF